MGLLYRTSEVVMSAANRVLARKGIVIQRRPVLDGDTSQNGELARLWPLLHDHPQPTVVDVGANDGLLFSNSWPLITRGWAGVLIEPNPARAAVCRDRHSAHPNVVVIEAAVSEQAGEAQLFADKEGLTGRGLSFSLNIDDNRWTKSTIDYHTAISVQTRPLDAILSEAVVPSNFALLSVDTEGHDLAVLRSLGTFAPTVIITERYLWNTDVAMCQVPADYVDRCGRGLAVYRTSGVVPRPG